MIVVPVMIEIYPLVQFFSFVNLSLSINKSADISCKINIVVSIPFNLSLYRLFQILLILAYFISILSICFLWILTKSD